MAPGAVLRASTDGDRARKRIGQHVNKRAHLVLSAIRATGAAKAPLTARVEIFVDQAVVRAQLRRRFRRAVFQQKEPS